jgi:histidine ammonia-lyase
METAPFWYGQDSLTPEAALALAEGRRPAHISDQVYQRLHASRRRVEALIERGETVYGVNTGFGPLCTTAISREQTRELQHNLLKSHAVGVGEDVSLPRVRLMLILKLHALCFGYSGISVEVVERLREHLARDLLPRVPQQGSLGASGDLAPLAHLFLPLIGEGELWREGAWQPAAEVLHSEGLVPLALGAKEALALINGTQFMGAYAVEIAARLGQALDLADIAGGMSLEAYLGSPKPFDADLHRLRPYAGNQRVARHLRALLHGSEMVLYHENCGRVQDPYSLRCMPQVHGAARQALAHLQEALAVELNSVTDNPLLFEDGKTLSGGNFHGQPLALPLDYAALAAHETGAISERRVYLIMHGGVENLPRLLLQETGTNSGFMILQYTAAALVSENRTLCFPASADSLPTSLGQEDHVSMGAWAARKCLHVIANLEKTLAIELLCAAQAFDFRRPLRSGAILEAVHAHIRRRVSHSQADRPYYRDLEALEAMIHDGSLLQTARQAAEKAGLEWA